MTKEFDLSQGFLPSLDPIDKMPQEFADWEYAAHNLPKLLLLKNFRSYILNLPPFPTNLLHKEEFLERALQITSYLAHAYIWGVKEAPQVLPKQIAVPLYDVSKRLGRPPVLSYASYALHNWKRFDVNAPIELGNIALIQNFLGGIDEEWFILVHVDIEAKAQLALKACLDAIKSTQENKRENLFIALKKVENSLQQMCLTLERMPERCDPYIYYHRVRPYIHGWKNHPAYPHGLIYEGVEEYQGIPQQFRGETGAQSSIIPSLDALLGITHAPDELHHYLIEMREYMPLKHRQFIEYLERNSLVRSYIQKHSENISSLKEVYNTCVLLIERFRNTHLSYAASYIQHQHASSSGNPNAVGTGGTPFMHYLQKHKNETSSFLLH